MSTSPRPNVMVLGEVPVHATGRIHLLTFRSNSGTGADYSNLTLPFLIPGEPGDLVTDWPEG